MLNTILIVVCLLLLIYFVLQILNPTNKVSSMQNGWEPLVVPAKDLKNTNKSSNYTYSIWFYVNDWNDKFGDEKILLQRGNNGGDFKIALGNMLNDIIVTTKTYSTTNICGGIEDSNNDDCAPITDTDECTNKSINDKNICKLIDANTLNRCEIKNFPLQKWINLVVSVQGTTLDIYIDGKLHKTCVLPNVPIIPDSDLVITPKDLGFNGWTSNVQYWDSATNPQEVYNIYKKGYGGGALGNLFNKYTLRFQLLKDNQVAGEVSI